MEPSVEGIGVVVCLVVGMVVVVMALRFFARRDGWADVDESVDSVEHAHLRRVAEVGISALSPGAIRLAERERVGAFRGDPRLAREFWRRFAAASASAEGDPAASLRELRGLPGLLEEALGEAERETAVVGDVPRREDER